jgi:hypothetical protein
MLTAVTVSRLALCYRAVLILRNATLWSVGTCPRSLRLDTGEPDHLGPFFGFVGDELPEVGRRAGKYHAAQLGKLRL